MKKATNKDKQMKKVTKNIKKVAKVDNDSYDLKRLLIILGVIIVICIGIYFLSKIIVNKRNNETSTDEVTAGSIDYDVTTVGMLLNRPYYEYYVIIYDGENSDAIYYSSLINYYQAKEDALKIYYCDLSNSLNSKYVSSENKGNAAAKSVSEFSFGDVTLIKVKKGKVASYIEDIDKIESILH